MKILTSLIGYMKTGNIALVSLATLAIITAVILITVFGASKVNAQQPDTGAATHTTQIAQAEKGSTSAMGLGLLAAAISTCVSAVAAGIAVSIVGSAALGAVAEKPEIMGRSIIFVGLAEGIAIYGLIISIMILGKI